jgi:sulfatase modifying factor 1
MQRVRQTWDSDGKQNALELVHVQGTQGCPFLFGDGNHKRPIEVQNFFLATIPVTQALWAYVMGPQSNPSYRRGEQLPVENVSWDQVTGREGFLSSINAGPVLDAVALQLPGWSAVLFRLPSEAEWEYAARGGMDWAKDFLFSGSNDIESVAWYQQNSGDRTHDVGQKLPNQLGLHDMSGNVWEWCQDCFVRDVYQIPVDGSPWAGPSDKRILRGGCFHNWAVHCAVSKRYELDHDYHDGCVGFRLALSEA